MNELSSLGLILLLALLAGHLVKFEREMAEMAREEGGTVDEEERAEE